SELMPGWLRMNKEMTLVPSPAAKWTGPESLDINNRAWRNRLTVWAKEVFPVKSKKCDTPCVRRKMASAAGIVWGEPIKTIFKTSMQYSDSCFIPVGLASCNGWLSKKPNLLFL